MDNPAKVEAPAYGGAVTVPVPTYRWSAGEFLRAWEAGAFDSRAELVEGDVWPVVIGDWHGAAVGKVIGLLWERGLRSICATLPSGDSLPDPDCWVRRPGAEPTARLGSRLSTFAPADVLLVVEISDETLMADLTTKARVYGGAGWPVYWVVSPEVVYVHTDPHPSGYRQRTEYRRGEQVPLPLGEVQGGIAVDELLDR